MEPDDALPQTEEEWGLAYGAGMPFAGHLCGRRDEQAMLDCLRVRAALALYPSRLPAVGTASEDPGTVADPAAVAEPAEHMPPAPSNDGPAAAGPAAQASARRRGWSAPLS